MNFKPIKDYWNNRPCNINHSKKEPLTIEYFNEIEEKKYFVEPHIKDFACFNDWNGKKVLELGCGIGTDSINFARAGAILTVVDISEKSLEICKKRFELFNLTARFINANIEEIDEILKDEKFDLIYSFGVIHHTIRPRKVIEAVFNLMTKDSYFKFMVYSRISYKLFWLMMENNIKDMKEGLEIVERQSEAQANCPMTYTYTIEEIRDELLDDRFKIENIYKDHIFIYNIDKYKNNEYEKDEYWRNMDDITIKKLEKELGWHTMVICKLN